MPARTAIAAVAFPNIGERTRDAFWPAVVAAAAIASCIPLWSSELLPFQDGPQHLAAIRVLADYHTPGFGFDRWFEIDLNRLQYLGFYLPAAALSKLVGPDAACRLMLSVIALALPASFWMLLGAFGRDRRLAVFAPLLFHTFPLYMGFLNFVESVPAAVAVVALTERQLQQPKRGRAIALAMAAALLLWLHPSALAFAIGCAAVQALTAGVPRRQVVRALASFLPALLLFAAWTARALAMRDGVGNAAKAAPTWQPLSWRVRDIFRFGNVLAGRLDESAVFACGALLVAAAVLSFRERAKGDWRLALLAAMTLVAYFAAPFEIGFMGYIDQRALPFFFLLAIASLPLCSHRAVGALCAAAVLVQVGYSFALSAAYRAFDQEAEVAQLEEVLGHAERGQRLFAHIWEQGSHVVQFQPYMHFGSYYEVQRGGRARYSFAETPWTPLRFKKGTEPPAPPRNWELHPERVVLSSYAAQEEYVLVRGPGAEPDAQTGFRLRARAGRWALYGR